jgi:hypothetical protein
MAEESSGGKPADFFVGLVDFFAILLPGAILTFWLYRCLEWDGALRCMLPPPPEGFIQVALYAVVAYVLGHLIYVIGSLCLDPLYDWWKESLQPESLKKLRDKANAVGKWRGVESLEGMGVVVRLGSAGATSEMERLEADQKFFRGLIIVLLLAWPSFLWSWGKFNWGWLGLALRVMPLVFGKPFEIWHDRLNKRREKSDQQKKKLHWQQQKEEIKEETEEVEKELKDEASEDEWRKHLQFLGLSVVVVGCGAWLCYWAWRPPTELTQPSPEIAIPCPESTKVNAKASATASGTTTLVRCEARGSTGEATENAVPPAELSKVNPKSSDASGSVGPGKSAPTRAADVVAVHLDKRWVAAFFALGLLLSAVRFGQQRVKYTEFVYRAYLALQ